MDKTLKKKISVTLKILIVICALGGVILSLFNAKKDGYSHWYKRLMYFTAQSNLWIGFNSLTILLYQAITNKSDTKRGLLYLCKYLFTVSITITAIVFFFFLAPFADQSYHIWTVSGFLTHLFSPLFSIADFIIDPNRTKLNKNVAFLAVLPPLIYVINSSVLSVLNVDFGRGVNYPYFFMDHFSPAGVFGFSLDAPILGSFYWILILALITFFIGVFYKKLKSRQQTKKIPA